MPLRHQLAAYSPLRARDVAAAAFGVFGSGSASRAKLKSLLERRYVARNAILVDSGTHALQLAIELAVRGQSAGTSVALPAFQCFDIATAAIGAGVRVQLYDVDPDTLGPDLASLERALQAGARVAVIAPLYGVPVDWDVVSQLAQRHGVTLIEDAAQGHGASWRERSLGSLGSFSTLSFGRGKGWTGGQGGAVLVRDTRFALNDNRVRGDEVKNVIALEAQWLLGRPSVYGLPRALPWLGLGETRYHAPSAVKTMAGSAARAILSSEAAADEEAAFRRTRAAELLERLPDGIRPGPARSGVAGYLRFPVRLAGGMRVFTSAAEASALGIAPSYPIVLADLEPLRPLLLERQPMPGAAALVADLVTLPTHSRVSSREVDRILMILETILSR